jgi:hypothetical protein
MADEDPRAELERLRRENEALKQAPKARVTMNVSDKGGLSVYGLGRIKPSSSHGPHGQVRSFKFE